MERPDWAPDDIDMEQPRVARVYDYLLGGSHNFASDRQLAHKVISAMPDAPLQAQANRAFLHRAVRYLVDRGLRQFLDIGSGIPTLGNVHEVAQRAAPDARVVYVDIDAVAVAHSREILAGNERATIIQEDLRRPERILDHPALRALLDLNQPVAVLLVAVLHSLPDADNPAGILERLRTRLAPGSYLVISHATQDSRPEQLEQVRKLYGQTATPGTLRSQVDVEGFFAGFTLVEPRVVRAPEWHPEGSDDLDGYREHSNVLVGVGRRD